MIVTSEQDERHLEKGWRSPICRMHGSLLTTGGINFKFNLVHENTRR